MTNDKGKYTAGKWIVLKEGGGVTYIKDAQDRILATIAGLDDGINNVERQAEAAANAARIVACVNGCEGINPEAVKEMLEACRLAVNSQGWDGNNPNEDRWTDLYNKLSAVLAAVTGEKL
jgi:hypothetical protein